MNESKTHTSKKRLANSPMVGKGKERREESMSDPQELNTQSCSRSTNGEYKNLVISNDSYLSAASQASKSFTKSIRKPTFTTKKPEGAFRDEIVVEIQTLDDQPFKGTITPKEARKTIFEEVLGFKQDDLIGFYFAYSGCPIVTFKLKEQFNIDNLESFQEFKVERKCKVQNVEKTATLRCKIRGVRSSQNNRAENYQDEGLRWIKVEGCEYRLEEKQIIDWLSHFGEIKSKILEDTHGGSDNSDDDLPPVGNGIYSVKMKLTRDMPQLIPMHGKKIRLYYRGIIKRCTNCFGRHQRKICEGEKVPWIKYVEQFIRSYPEIPRESYGRWANIVDGLKLEQDGDLTIRPEQKIENISAKTTEPQTEKTPTAKEKDSETGKGELKTEESTNVDEVGKLVKRLIAAGISIETVRKMVDERKKETNEQTRGTGPGRGRGRKTKL